jgi:hypothetical protein
MGRRHAAALDEDAELRALSDQAEQGRQAVADTADALTRAITANAHASVLARRVVVRGAASAHQAISPRRFMAVAAVPAVVVVTVAAVYLLRRHPR